MIDIHPSNIIFLDIETVPEVAKFEDLPERKQKLWEKKSLTLNRRKENSELTASDVWNEAGLFAEFGKIICLSVGTILKKKEEEIIYVRSYAGDDEKIILNDFQNMILNRPNREALLCAHNGKEFDFPYIGKRIVINGMELIGCLNPVGKKPWEISHIDTMELWRFGKYKDNVSLDLLSALFNIPSPKQTMDGSEVFSYYYEQGDLPSIQHYCELDVVTMINVYLKFQGKEIIEKFDVYAG